MILSVFFLLPLFQAVLNVYIEIEELEDLTVTIDISGDKKSCSVSQSEIFGCHRHLL